MKQISLEPFEPQYFKLYKHLCSAFNGLCAAVFVMLRYLAVHIPFFLDEARTHVMDMRSFVNKEALMKMLKMPFFVFIIYSGNQYQW